MHQKTVFDNRLFSVLLRKVATIFFRLKSWKLSEDIPSSVTKAVVVAAPHTTGFDLLYIILLSAYFDLPIRWIAKEELFIWPFRGILMWLGGIPVKRHSSESKTVIIGKMLRETDKKMFLVIAPAGTRKNLPVEAWNKGYYYIALYAGVPLIFATINYKNKRASVSFPFMPNGDHDSDIHEVKRHYRNLFT